MSFPVRLNCILLGTFFTLPFLLTMLPAKMFLNSGEISECARRIVVDASFFGTNVDFLFYGLFVVPLLQLPWQIVTSPMKL
ncbi:hypothetical protein HanRHA438_Chr07g0312641 [Helianthus annuus]|uniref:Uncharacterized protein n=1 Tax=Helianthus annuus TaxID=4232 RepID=A0A9K3IMP7_HELAN|nr:hypothetical protein HanXRQr2_Chr07g0302801 [Helianthus annuus]KAJ0908640.1 hypothetical protein HanRHA438_Chr07g0312641 [Helianthus annuus]